MPDLSFIVVRSRKPREVVAGDDEVAGRHLFGALWMFLEREGVTAPFFFSMIPN
jgi:hypothetical protein